MTPEAQLERFVARSTPEIAAPAGAALARMRKRFPSADQLMYDNYNALAIGLSSKQCRSSNVHVDLELALERP